MQSKKVSLRIDKNGSLLQYNERLRRWELASRAWGWDDIDPEYLSESRKNWRDYQKRINK
ncbi:MAG TPA: hypothetical protein PKC39_08285 [Ferruginibacter sp.]|nr:hypothetical protein [Ferruginibacter sp.]HMP20940.1 hypothetical protein [Ferruginibacter sp.]